MRSKFLALTAATVMAGTALTLSSTAASADDGGHRLIRFESMMGNARPAVGAAGAVRGINAGGLPWVVAEAEGEVRADGRVNVEVEGLLIDPNDPAAIALNLGGTNPAPTFKVVVSCETMSGVVNVSTPAVAGGPTGTAEFEAKVALPSMCANPIVFVTSGGGAWFARTA